MNAAARVLTLRVHAFLLEGTCNKEKSTFVCRMMASGKCSEEVTEMGEEWHTGVGRPCLKKKKRYLCQLQTMNILCYFPEALLIFSIAFSSTIYQELL